MSTWKHRLGKHIIPNLPVNRRGFDLLRFELNAAITRILNRVYPPYILKIRRLSRQDNISINVGSGGTGRSDWVNIDVRRHHRDQSVAYDIRKGLPFRSDSVDRIFAEHVVEHLEFNQEATHFLRDCHRVLKPGGFLRVIVPDGERWLHAYVTKDATLWRNLGMPQLPEDMPTPMAMINHVFHQNGEHFFAYDFATMDHILRMAGFSYVDKSSFGQSADPELALDLASHQQYSLYVEARKSLE